MTAVNITFADPGSDLLAYLADWVGPPQPITNHGEFNTANTQWAGGDEPGGTTNAVVLDGSNFQYPAFGGFTGTVDTLTFGDGLSGTAAGSNFSIDDVQLTLDLGGVAADNTFNFAIYGLQTGTTSYLEAYFDQAGTVQHSTTGADFLYGFDATDTFVFAASGNGADEIDDFAVNEDIIDLSAVASITDFTDLVNNHLSDDGSGNAQISWGSGNSIVLAGHAYSTFSTTFDVNDFDFA